MPNPTPSDPFARRDPALAREPEIAVSAVPVASAPVPALPAPAMMSPVRVPRAALTSGRRWRQASRWIGLGLFGVGASLLGYVFLQALHGFQEFQQPDYLSQQFNRISGDTWQSMIQAVVGVMGTQILSVLYLLLLGFLASAIASKGIQFFAASEAVIDEAVAAVE